MPHVRQHNLKFGFGSIRHCRQHPLKADRFGSPDPFRFGRSRPMSPDPVRPMSPDGLGGGLYSSVFVDTGVEGLLQPSPVNLRQIRSVAEMSRWSPWRELGIMHQILLLLVFYCRQHVVSPKSSESNLPSLQTPSRRADNEQMKSLRIELGSGEDSKCRTAMRLCMLLSNKIWLP